MTEQLIYILFMTPYNILFFTFGVFLLVMGLSAYVYPVFVKSTTNAIINKFYRSESGYHWIAVEDTMTAGWLWFIFIGVLMCVLALEGLHAVFTCSKIGFRYRCYAGTIVVVIAIVFLLFIFFATMALFFKHKLADMLTSVLINNYHPKATLGTAIWNMVMVEWDCCGVRDYKDFQNTTWKKVSYDLFPKYCCKFDYGETDNVFIPNDECSIEPDEMSNYRIGCAEAAERSISKYILLGFFAMTSLMVFLYCALSSVRLQDLRFRNEHSSTTNQSYDLAHSDRQTEFKSTLANTPSYNCLQYKYNPIQDNPYDMINYPNQNPLINNSYSFPRTQNSITISPSHHSPPPSPPVKQCQSSILQALTCSYHSLPQPSQENCSVSRTEDIKSPIIPKKTKVKFCRIKIPPVEYTSSISRALAPHCQSNLTANYVLNHRHSNLNFPSQSASSYSLRDTVSNEIPKFPKCNSSPLDFKLDICKTSQHPQYSTSTMLPNLSESKDIARVTPISGPGKLIFRCCSDSEISQRSSDDLVISLARIPYNHH